MQNDEFFKNFDRQTNRMGRRFGLMAVGLMFLNCALALGMLGGGLWVVIYVLRMTGVIH